MPGEHVFIDPCVTETDANRLFPGHETIIVPSNRTYLRKTQLP